MNSSTIYGLSTVNNRLRWIRNADNTWTLRLRNSSNTTVFEWNPSETQQSTDGVVEHIISISLATGFTQAQWYWDGSAVTGSPSTHTEGETYDGSDIAAGFQFGARQSDDALNIGASQVDALVISFGESPDSSDSGDRTAMAGGDFSVLSGDPQIAITGPASRSS